MMRIICFALVFVTVTAQNNNLSCYQCTKTKNERCGEDALLPCHPSKDRCVTHISKDVKNGFSIKRECGLGPCGFDDDMVNKGLGLDRCDTSRDDYFCVFCCKTTGCNKDAASQSVPSVTVVMATAMLVAVFRIFR